MAKNRIKKDKTIYIPMKALAGLSTPDKRLTKAARQMVREIHNHFKEDDWDLDFSYYSHEVFYQVFGHHLENYMLKAIAKSKKPYVIKGSPSGLVVGLDKKKRK